MKKQSDTPRTGALMSAMKWVVADDNERVSITISGLRQLERELTAVKRERDEARALNAQWAEKAATWLATPEAAQRLQGYRDLAQQVAEAQNERDEAIADLETERMRLAACGVIALANTRESAAKARDMLPQYRSASSEDVARAVDSEMELRAEVERLRSEIEQHVAEAVAKETERCAVAAREWEDNYVIEDSAPGHVDDAIRARAKKEAT